MSWTLPFLAALIVVIGGLAALAACGERSDVRDTNLLIITVDTLRADRLGAYGYEPIETPHIDRLAREGVLFTRAVTPAPLTLPAHATLFTGTTPPRHGIRENGAASLAPSAVTLAERFRDAGHATGGFVGAFVLDPRYGLSQGFETFTGPGVAAGSIPAEHSASERRGDEVLEDALEWIGAQAASDPAASNPAASNPAASNPAASNPTANDPAASGQTDRGPDRAGRTARGWFAWIHLFDPHASYTPPEPFASTYADRPYDGEVAWVDSLVGRLQAALEESGDWAETTVVLTSDHGEALGDHGEPTHGFFLYEPTLRVPLIVRPADRGGAGLERGIEVATTVGLVDIYPTVLELWNLESGEQAGQESGEEAAESPDRAGAGPGRPGDEASAELEGRSLAPALRGERITAVPLYAETVLPRSQYGWSDLKAIVDGPDKYIEAPSPELYDVQEDPGERDNLVSERPGRAAELRAELESRLTAPTTSVGISGTQDGGSPEVDSRTLARLRSLGYLAGGTGGGAGGGGAAGGISDDSGTERPDPKEMIDTYNALVEILATWRDGEPMRALELLDAELQQNPGSGAAWYHRGLVLNDLGRLEEAADAFAWAWELDPDHVVAARWLARTHRQAGDLDAAVAVVEELLRADPADARLRWEVAQFHLRRGDPSAAEAVLREGLEVDADAPPLLLGLGQVELRRDRPARALELLDSAAAVAPELDELHYYRGRALRRLGRTDEALEAYAVELSHQPLHFGALLDRAVLLAQQGRNAATIESLRAALSARPDSAQARLFLARSLLESGDPRAREEARRLGEQVLETVEGPDLRRRAHATLARILRSLGRVEEARAHEEQAAGIGARH